MISLLTFWKLIYESSWPKQTKIGRPSSLLYLRNYDVLVVGHSSSVIILIFFTQIWILMYKNVLFLFQIVVFELFTPQAQLVFTENPILGPE
jgi:hypothetical protein